MIRLARILLPVLLLGLVACGGREAPASQAVATAHPLATEAALEVLRDGGNAFDAAVTASAVLAVVEPYGSGMGGGGFWLLHRASDGHEVMIDGRETAPGEAHADMYVREDGSIDQEASRAGPLAAAIPGQPAALVHLAQEYGRLPLERLLAPAIELARDGFEADPRLIDRLERRGDVLSPVAAAIFMPDGELPDKGQVLRQPALAETLEKIVAEGRDGFYTGEVAERLVEGVREAGGIWTLDDLVGYQVVEREPVVAEVMGMRVVSAAPPSSGGVTLVQTLNILDGLDLAGADEAGRIHLTVEAMRRAYHDRARYLGDPDFVAMPLARLLSEDYAAGLRTSIHPERALPSAHLAPVAPGVGGGPSTSHFSIIDGEGNRVAATLTINWPWGAGLMIEDTGILLNNEMDDFTARPGEPNAYGLVHSRANAIAPGKRMLSSMSPSFVEQGERLAILGTPGGGRIISMVLLGMLNFADGAEAEAIVSAPRYHHQYLPDVIQHEPDTFSEALQAQLREFGHELESVGRTYGDMHVITRGTDGVLRAASDPRGIGEAKAE